MFVRPFNIGVAVADAVASFNALHKIFGLEKHWDRALTGVGVERDIVLRVGKEHLVELQQPIESDENPMRRFLNRRGDCLFNVAMVVDDVEKRTKEIEAKGVPVWVTPTAAENAL